MLVPPWTLMFAWALVGDLLGDGDLWFGMVCYSRVEFPQNIWNNAGVANVVAYDTMTVSPSWNRLAALASG